MKVVWTNRFLADVAYYVKKKKYLKIKNDIKPVTDSLERGEFVGDELKDISVSGKTFKVRTANTSANVGKSNGFRIIYYAISEDDKAYLLTIYSKKDDIRILSDSDIRKLIEENIEPTDR